MIASMILYEEFLMSKFAIGDRVDKATDDHEGGVVIAVFRTDDGNFRYAVDMEGYGALQFLTEEKLVHHARQSETMRVGENESFRLQ
jgi:hypothetical protein